MIIALNERLNKLGLSTIFKIPKKLDLLIKRGKDKLTDCCKTEVVYCIDCKDCEACYIGQTKRHLQTRVKEHYNDIRKQEPAQSVVSKHRSSCDHDFDWSKPRVLHTEKFKKKREIAEMFYIKKHNNAINLKKDTENLSYFYDLVIKYV